MSVATSSQHLSAAPSANIATEVGKPSLIQRSMALPASVIHTGLRCACYDRLMNNRNTKVESHGERIGDTLSSPRSEVQSGADSMSREAENAAAMAATVASAGAHPPWISNRVIFQNQEEYAYRALKIRLVEVATRSRHRCQRLYVDFVSAQYWLGVTTSSRYGGFGYEVLKPISDDTANSLIAGE